MRIRMVTVIVAALCLVATSEAQRTFTKRVGYNVKGDITIIGNTIMQGGTNRSVNGSGNNDNYYMVHVDNDGNSSTFNSSRATLTLPSGVTGSDVLWAGLYWQSYSNASYAQSGEPANSHANRYKILFGTSPTAYVQYTATQQDWFTSSDYSSGQQGWWGDVNTLAWHAYQGYFDVTNVVQAAGSVTYYAANIVCPYNYGGVSAGWSLVVLYKKSNLPLRNIVVWDGYTKVEDGSPTTIPVAGFKTPPTGMDVVSNIGVVSFEGDLGITGDYLRLDENTSSHNLYDGINAGTNYFNSSMSIRGTRFTAKDPNVNNQLGYDFHIIQTTNMLAHLQTSSTIYLGSDGDLYYPGVVFFMTDIVGPAVQAEKWFVTDDPLLPPLDDELYLELPQYVDEDRTMLYHFRLQNTGDETANNSVLIDAIPEHQEYVPGSMQISPDGINWTSLNDAQSGDAGWFDNTNPTLYPRGRVVIGSGSGASTTAGGAIPISTPSSQTYYYARFKTIIDDATNLQTNTMPETPVPNRALITYRDNSSSPPSDLESNSTEVTLIIFIEEPFPVELVAFNASLRNDIVTLRWETATETNNYGFDIERSLDGSTWQTVGFVAGAGMSSSPKSYTYQDKLTDREKSVRDVLYRLRQIDRDGTSEHSPVVSVSPVPVDGTNVLLQNYPNPFNPSTSIAFALRHEGPVTLTVYNALGVEVARLIDGAVMEQGWHSMMFNAADLPSGRYLCRLQTEHGTSSSMMILTR